MAKIVVIPDKTSPVRVGILDRGAVFQRETGLFYMKTGAFGEGQCVNLDSGLISQFHPTSLVIPRPDAEIHIK